MIWLTRMPDGASSIARVLASADTLARSTVERPRLGIGSFTEAEVDMRMAPPPRACMSGTAARTIRSALNSSRLAASCHASSSKDTAAPAGGPPEFVNSRSTPPKRFVVSPAHRVMSAADRTSTGRASTSPPIRPAALSIACASLDAMDTRAPSCASACATANPSPRLAPATMATLPVSPSSMLCSSLLPCILYQNCGGR